MFAPAYMGRQGRGGAPSNALLYGQKDSGQGQGSSMRRVKAFEKLRFRPMYAEANMGHPSRTKDFGEVIRSVTSPISDLDEVQVQPSLIVDLSPLPTSAHKQSS